MVSLRIGKVLCEFGVVGVVNVNSNILPALQRCKKIYATAVKIPLTNPAGGGKSYFSYIKIPGAGKPWVLNGFEKAGGLCFYIQVSKGQDRNKVNQRYGCKKDGFLPGWGKDSHSKLDFRIKPYGFGPIWILAGYRIFSGASNPGFRYLYQPYVCHS